MTYAPVHSSHTDEIRRSRTKRSSREYRTIYALTFPLFLVAACIARLTGHSSHTGERSIFGEAKKLASASIPMAFMG
ncbi:MAG: hypothetical protein ACK4MV_18365 [Beijerinckiaceae bacterium]